MLLCRHTYAYVNCIVWTILCLIHITETGHGHRTKAASFRQQGLTNCPVSKFVSNLAPAANEHLLREKALREANGLEEVDHPRLGHKRRLVRQVSSCPIPDDATFTCDPTTKYQTIDGTCNNLLHPKWGGANRGMANFIPPTYDDGIGSPRLAADGGELPSARAISRLIFTDVSRPSPVLTIMHMTLGQLVAHDVLITPLSTDNGAEVSCGDSCATSEVCMPIAVDDDDPDFIGLQCLNFVRSQPGFNDDCSNTARVQMNALTSWVDATHLYGPSAEKEAQMRDTTNTARGRLVVTPHPIDSTLKELLPVIDGACGIDDVMKCFAAGDARVNVQVGLTSMHTLWQRTHNTLEERLYTLNPQWGGEKLYQETRRLVIAIWQHIVYNEYLPTMLGPGVVRKYDLMPQPSGFFYTGYDSSVLPDIATDFATGAFRFGHSQIGDYLKFSDNLFAETVQAELSKFFKNPSALYNTSAPGGSGVDAILLGHITQPAEDPDAHFSKQVSAHLFTPDPPFGVGHDLVSMNIQRGRDHGIPSYLDYRRFCNLSVATDFSNLQDIPRRRRDDLQTIYTSVEDIDLYVGGLSENRLFGTALGKTFNCIIAKQFVNLKKGNRFFYENDDATTGFTLAQLDEIRKFTLSKIMCDNLDNVATIQKYVLVQPYTDLARREYSCYFRVLMREYNYEDNDRRPCSYLEEPDLSPWQE